MTVATLLLALLTATNPSSGGGASADPILLDFHADWCGPCQRMRPAIDQLTRKGLPIRSVDIDRSPAIAQKYGVSAVPTFVVVDRSGRELDRTSGLQPAAVLEQFYQNAAAKARPAAAAPDQDDDAPAARRPVARHNDDLNADPDADASPDAEESRPARPVRRVRQERVREDRDDRANDADDRLAPPPAAAPPFANPHPARTVVRIKVVGQHSTGFGSGTIISSSPEETLVLTCAHIFHVEGRGRQPSPEEFPHQIVLDLFDGQLHPQPSGTPKLNYVESFQGQAVDYDFDRDVGLIRFRAGRQLPASRVVPAHWHPARPMKMLTLGCSEGHDATAWHTRIMNPQMKGFLSGKPSYEAMECEFAPKQGRSGGGLFTTDGYIAGVCNFAEPQGDHGLYATPRSIYALLDRNGLASLYAPVVREGGPGNTLMADNRSTRPAPSRAPLTGGDARMQSPDNDEPRPRRSSIAAAGAPPADDDTGEVLLPHYRFLGIKDPVGTDGDLAASPPRSASSSGRRVAWLPPRDGSRPASSGTELDQDQDQEPMTSAVGDEPATAEPGAATPTATETAATTRTGTKAASGRTHWRTVSAATGSEE